MDERPGDADPTPATPAMPAPPPASGGLSLGGRNGPSVAATGQARLGGWLSLAGGVAAVIGALALPWFTASGPGGTVTIRGTSASGFGILILSGFAIAKGLQVVAPDRFSWRLSTPILTGVLMFVLLAFRWSDISDALDRARSLPGVTAAVGSGFWLAGAGAVLVLCGGLLLQFGGTRR